MHERQTFDLAALLAARICHDLINPIGAISNGLEMLALQGTKLSAELELIDTSTQSAAARLAFFRVAFGPARAGGPLRSDELHRLSTAYFAPAKLVIEWQGDQPEVPRQQARILLLLLMCVKSALPSGGRAVVLIHGSASSIAVTAPRILAEPALWHPLQDHRPLPELNAGQVHFALAAKALQAAGTNLAATFQPDTLELTLRAGGRGQSGPKPRHIGTVIHR